MTAWIESILVELKGVTEAQESFAEPDKEPGPHDHIVGVAGADLRKLFFLAKQYQRRVFEIVAALTVCSVEEREERSKELECFGVQAEALKNIFFVSIRAAFPDLWDKLSIGIRRGWKVVWTDPEAHPLGLLGALLGASALEEVLRGSAADSEDESANSAASRLN